MKQNALTDFEKKLKEFLDSDSADCTSFMNEEYNFENTRWGTNEALEETIKGVAYTCVDRYGGEDQGSDYYSIYEFKLAGETVHVKFQGWYASHYGSEFREWGFVRPAQKLVTVFE